MVDCHDLFQDFYNKIILSNSKKEYLERARDALRLKIENYFINDMIQTPPEFKEQGSYAMSTIINPIDGEFDIDDGICLKNIEKEKLKWPSTQTVHDWILKAVEGHTDTKPKDKRTCVRVIYAGQYHVDLPIYGKYINETYLAEKGELSWHKSDPTAFLNWFEEIISIKGEHLRKIIIYIKAWADFHSRSVSLPSSFILTILAIEGYEKSNRDDVSFAGTLRNIYDRIQNDINIINPVDNSENLTKRLSDAQIDNFKDKLLTLMNNASIALKEESKIKACKIWRKEFGDRFPNCDLIKEIEKPLQTSRPALLKDDHKSA